MIITSLSKLLTNPITILLLFATISLIVSVISNMMYLLMLFIIILIVAITSRSIKKMLIWLINFTPILIIYTSIASFMQIVVIGSIDLYLLVINIIRIETLISLSMLVVNLIDVVKLVLFFRKISPKLALSLALSVKMLRDFEHSWKIIKEIYVLNFDIKRFKDQIKIITLIAKVFLSLSIYSSIQIAEAIATRPILYIHHKVFKCCNTYIIWGKHEHRHRNTDTQTTAQ